MTLKPNDLHNVVADWLHEVTPEELQALVAQMVGEGNPLLPSVAQYLAKRLQMKQGVLDQKIRLLDVFHEERDAPKAKWKLQPPRCVEKPTLADLATLCDLVGTIRGAHNIDIKIRKDAVNTWIEGDWIKYLDHYLQAAVDASKAEKPVHKCPGCSHEFTYTIHPIRRHKCPSCETMFDDKGRIVHGEG